MNNFEIGDKTIPDIWVGEDEFRSWFVYAKHGSRTVRALKRNKLSRWLYGLLLTVPDIDHEAIQDKYDELPDLDSVITEDQISVTGLYSHIEDLLRVKSLGFVTVAVVDNVLKSRLPELLSPKDNS